MYTHRPMAGEEGDVTENGQPDERERDRDRGKSNVWGEAARRARSDQPERRERRSPRRR